MEAIKNFPDSEMDDSIQQRILKKQKRNKIIRYSIAGLTSIVLLVVIIVGYNFLTLSSNKVYRSGYIPYQLPDLRNEGVPDKAIEKAYREKKYSKVKSIHKSGEDNSIKGEFLNGMSNLETNELVKAINSFKEVLELNKESDKPLLNDETEYYLALAYIKNRDYDLALDLLQQIRDNKDHTYFKKITAKMVRKVKLLKWR